MKSKKGFTLVEVVAIIAIIGIIAILVIPQIKSNMYAKKEKQYQNIVSTIKSAAKVYYSEDSSSNKIYISTLISNDFLSSQMINPLTNDEISGCVVISQDDDSTNIYEYVSDLNICNYEQIVSTSLIVELDGGQTTQNFQLTYRQGERIDLIAPSHTNTNYAFVGWIVLSGNSTLNGSQLTIGSTTTTIKARWANKYTVLYDCNNGTGIQTTSKHAGGVASNLTLNTCYKITTGTSGKVYYFVGWGTTSSDTTVDYQDGASITLTGNITLYAIWNSWFTYSGSYDVTNSGKNWKLKMYSTGTLTVNALYPGNVDIFLVGGGGAGRYGAYSPGGGGGYTYTKKNLLIPVTSYTITVGTGGIRGDTINSNGKDSIAIIGGITYTGEGGKWPSVNAYTGGIGGSGGGGYKNYVLGGDGGFNGGSGLGGAGVGGSGQGGTTREFGEATGDLYAGGGGGYGGVGGDGGGGHGGNSAGSSTAYGTQGTDGLGGGGGAHADGGDGIVIIRNHQN